MSIPQCTRFVVLAALASVAALRALAAPAPATESEPSVEVQTVMLQQRSLADQASGYGVVAPAADSVRTLSLPRAGQLLRLRASVGQKVNKGSSLLDFGTGADAELAWRQAALAVDFARGELQRMRSLLEQQLATRSQVAGSEKALADAQAVLALQQQLGADRGEQVLRAPFDGVVVAVLASPGERLAAGAPLLQLAGNGRLQAQVGLEPGDARRVRAGMAARVTDVVTAGNPVPGRVVQVAGVVDPQSQLVNVRIELPASKLMPGARVAATIALTHQVAWVVPRSAVLRDARGAYLFQVRAGRARRIAVQSGLEEAGQVAVQGNFDPALPVVSQGNYEVTDGMAVRGSGR